MYAIYLCTYFTYLYIICWINSNHANVFNVYKHRLYCLHNDAILFLLRTSGEGGSRKVHRRRKTFTHRFDKHFKLRERIKMKKSGAPKQKKPKKQKRNH